MIKKHWPVLLLLLVLIIATYINSFNNVFLSDDIAEIVQNPNIGNIGTVFAHPLGFIRLMLYWLAFHLGGLTPIFFRFINIFFHIGTVFLIFLLFKRLYSQRLAIFVASIFAVHPAISEAVVWISGGSYPQYTFFFLLSFAFYLLSKKSKKYYWASLAAFIATFISHPQMPLLLFLIFPLWELSFGDLRKNFLKTTPYLLIAIVFLITVLGSLPERETTLQSVHYQQKGVDNVFVLIPIAVTSYFQLTFFPSTLTLYHSELAFDTFQFMILALITLTFLVTILISFKKNKYIFFWSSFFLIALAPTLTPFRLNWIVAERYLYLPILGILALVGLGLERLTRVPKVKQAVYILFSIAILSLSIRTILRNIDWKTEDNLWIATGKTSPSSPNTHNNLGDVYGRHGDKQAALREFQKAIEIKPNYGDAYHNLANTYVELGQIDKALENYQNALKYNPGLWQSYQNIAAIYFQAKKYDLTIEYLQKAIQVNPRNLNLRDNLGIVYLTMGQKEKAKEIFSAILSVNPQDPLAQKGYLEASK